MGLQRWMLTVAMGVFLVGCPTEANDDDANVCGDLTRAQTYVEGLEANSASETVFVSLMSASPVPPNVDGNDWMLDVSDAAGDPLMGCTGDVVPFMPDHGHGTTGTPMWTETDPADGTYTTSWQAIMPGYWEITLTLDCGDGSEDHVFGFCAEG